MNYEIFNDLFSTHSIDHVAVNLHVLLFAIFLFLFLYINPLIIRPFHFATTQAITQTSFLLIDFIFFFFSTTYFLPRQKSSFVLRQVVCINTHTHIHIVLITREQTGREKLARQESQVKCVCVCLQERECGHVKCEEKKINIYLYI